MWLLDLDCTPAQTALGSFRELRTTTRSVDRFFCGERYSLMYLLYSILTH